jgi:multidrug efflux pump subunit AcrB
MPKDADSLRFNPHNLLIAVVGCVLISGLCAVTLYLTADFILTSIHKADFMVLLITPDQPGGFASDDKRLQENLNSATQALITCRDISLALAFGCALIGGALAYRALKPAANG